MDSKSRDQVRLQTTIDKTIDAEFKRIVPRPSERRRLIKQMIDCFNRSVNSQTNV